MVCACNTCDNYDENTRWCYIYQFQVRPGLESKPNKCRSWEEWNPDEPKTRFIDNIKVV